MTEIVRRNSFEEESLPEEYTVSELSRKIRNCLRDGVGSVLVRAELGRVTLAPSGHLYIDLKDDKAVLNGVMWRTKASTLTFRPETGLEVICGGRLDTYAPRSNYQLIIESLEPAGEGALLAQFEARRRKLAGEGLFDEARKRPLPFLPRVIGVVTSPAGEVIHDILHRLSGRFPRRVLLWPTRVQGDNCADEVVAAIEGFNALPPEGSIPRPDLLIVARGGGSLEDLWPFNEERVVRSAANSSIPLISAIGHETDVTLIDHAADKRAPTPTAAAEFAVPVRSDLLNDTSNLERRLYYAMTRRLESATVRLHNCAQHMRRSGDAIALLSQRFDMAEQRFASAFTRYLSGKKERYTWSEIKFAHYSPRKMVEHAQTRVGHLEDRAQRAINAFLLVRKEKCISRSELLKAISHQSVLERGFVLVWAGRQLLSRAADARTGMNVELEFAGAQRVGAAITAEISGVGQHTEMSSEPASGQEILFERTDGNKENSLR